MTQNENILEQAIFQLLGKLPYYGALIQSMKHVLTRQVPTAGVRFDPNGVSVQLFVNPDFLASLTVPERIALLIHEASHVDRLHLIRLPLATSNHRLGNIAADIAINCYIQDLPKGALYPKEFNLKKYQTFEYYLKRLSDNKNDTEKQKAQGQGDEGQGEPGDDDEGQGNGQGEPVSTGNGSKTVNKKFVSSDMDSLDVHDWENSGLSVSEQASVIENTMQRAIDKLGLDAGSLPEHVQESLRLLRELKVKAWHRDLKVFLGRTVNGFELERTSSRRNRRYGLNEPGTKVSGQRKLVVAFDTSGSMSQTELERCLAETMALVKTGAVGYLIQFDSKINAIDRLKRNMDIVTVHGRGGTSFVDVMNKIDGLHCDGLVIFTDGADSGPKAVKPRTPVLWVNTTGQSRDRYDWGFKTQLERT